MHCVLTKHVFNSEKVGLGRNNVCKLVELQQCDYYSYVAHLNVKSSFGERLIVQDLADDSIQWYV